MSTAAALRYQIEKGLESRFPTALSPLPRSIREVASTGIPEADRILDGGLPIGAISEITGSASSGRTSLVLSFLAQRTAEERFCAWIDTHDALDPESAAATGVSLEQLLWVRCQDRRPDSHETGRSFPRKRRPWSRLDQAIRATDLLLQAGGFCAIVLDLGDTSTEHGKRIPLATWFRFRQAADRTRTSLIVLGQSSYAQSSAAVVLECAPLRPVTEGGTVLCGFTFQLQRGRQRFTPHTGALKPPVSTWSASATWTAEKRA